MPSWLLCIYYAVRVVGPIWMVTFRLITESDLDFIDLNVQRNCDSTSQRCGRQLATVR
jgi:hypothetical protein